MTNVAHNVRVIKMQARHVLYQALLLKTRHRPRPSALATRLQPTAITRKYSNSSNICFRLRYYNINKPYCLNQRIITPVHNNINTAGLFLSNKHYTRLGLLLVQTFTSESDSSKRQSIAPLLERFKKLENSFRYHGYSTLRIGVLISIIIGLTLYIFQEPIRSNVVEEVSQVASRSLEDEKVAVKAEEFAKGLLNAIINDDVTLKLAVNFINGILDREETQKAANELLYKVISNVETQEKLTCLCKDVLVATVNDPKIKNEFIHVMKLVLRSEEVADSIRNLFKNAIIEQDVQEMMAQFFKSVLAADVVVQQATLLGKNVTKNIMSDAAIQEEAGYSIWKAVGYSLTPSWFTSSKPPSDESTPVEEDKK